MSAGQDISGGNKITTWSSVNILLGCALCSFFINITVYAHASKDVVYVACPSGKGVKIPFKLFINSITSRLMNLEEHHCQGVLKH